ncbi:MAG: GAF domain-containing protein [Deltaproteobacteria bacterium]|nr:GAF domain-containing protein [Deltaproteobacteria bacterium]
MSDAVSASRRVAEGVALVAGVLDEPAATAALTSLERIADAHRLLCALLAGADDAEAAELLALAERLVREGYVARLEGQERVRSALARLAELGPVTEIIDRGALEACAAVDLDRVVLSRVADGALLAEAVHWRDDPGMAETTLALLRAGPVRLDYPLIESEMVRRRRPLLVEHPEADPRGRPANAAIIGWRDFVASPILLEGRVTGFLHGDRLPTQRRVTALDRELLWSFAHGFAQVFERAVLRRRLRTQREEMRQVAGWADARTGELSDRAVDLAVERGQGAVEPRAQAAVGSEAELRDLLTRRELDVLRLMVQGDTNGAIARALVISEGTVKFHVKNILRKLRVANRAEATSRYLHLAYRRGGVPGA